MSLDEGYQEAKAVEFIRNYLPTELKNKYTDDEILTVVDIIWDYYEQKGLLSLNDLDTEDELLNVDELQAYVKREIKADEDLVMDSNDVSYIVKGELEYEESLEDFL